MRSALAKNLAMILRHRDMSEKKLEIMTGGEIAQKTINNLKNNRQSATLDTVEVLARALKIDPLLLLQEGLTEDMVSTPSVSRLYKHYTEASADGRQMIHRVAEREAEYASKKAS